MESDSTRYIRLFMESTCHSCLIAEVTDGTTCEGAYAVNLLDMGMSVWEKMVHNQMAVTIKKRDTVTFDHSGCDRAGCCQTEYRLDYCTHEEGSAVIVVLNLTPLYSQIPLQRLKKYLWGNLTIVGVIVAVIVIASLIGVIIALIGYKYCQHNTPCKNGGTCVDLPGFKYVCVCPHCLCSTAKPFGDCIINKATICKTEDLPPGKLVPHPYLCIKFYSCHPNATLRREQFVYKYADGNHVFNPATELSDYPEKVACAKQEVIELCADIACANGGTCQDTASGFMCECVPGYKGRKCEIVK
ncbi:hypothetical protein LSAT2_002819 [Lamellibrachia satsuma]|nr:hypothetical protein LSAT2_002819 [Lamellibrachia satsuma]